LRLYGQIAALSSTGKRLFIIMTNCYPSFIATRLRQHSVCPAVVLAALLSAAPALAVIQTTGQVLPADDSNTFQFSNADGGVENNEGIQEFIPALFGDGNAQDTYEEGDSDKLNIEVGIDSYGKLIISNASIVRYGHLVLGGSKDDILDDGTGGASDLEGPDTGLGVVEIRDFGTVYNNDPSIEDSRYANVNDPNIRDESDGGYDVYVGLTGRGRLDVLNGGRMEIEDILAIGVGESGFGEVFVEGFGSHIEQRGSGATGSDPGGESSGIMLIGPVGEGKLTIQMGGSVDARNGASIGGTSLSGTVGGDPDIGIPIGTGANGTGIGEVIVDGVGSLWRIGAGLSIGDYAEDIDDYDHGQGDGELVVSNGGRVSISRVFDTDGNDGDAAGLLVGKGDRVILDSGRITMTDSYLSDGVLTGHGRVDLGTFNNRALGEVRVGVDQHLAFTSNASDSVSDDVGDYFMANDGLIEVVGGEIEFERLFEEDDDRFKNRFVAAAMDVDPVRGVIQGQDAVMRFHSGLSNESEIAFTSGVNIVGGDVFNETTGSILLTGGSNTTFQDSLTNMGVLELAPTGSTVDLTILGDFIGATSASLSLNLGGGPTGAESSHIAVSGDIALAGALIVDAITSGSSPLALTPGDEFELISGAGALTGAFSVLDLPMLSDPAWSWLIDTSGSDFTLVVSDIIAVGADFNGDGIVDRADLEVWRMNYGISMGATGVLGDADGDGDVDGSDYFAWLDQVGGEGMPGALTAPGFQSAPVPEPGSIALLAGGIALCGWMRRCS